MNLVQINNNQVTTNSKTIAEVFGKTHHHVCRDIEKLEIPEDFRAANFGASTYRSKNKNGQILPMYNITRDGFTLLAMGFTGAKALQFKLKYIQAFNEMEEKLKAKSLPARDYWEVDDAELLRCLHAWHYTKSKADTLKFRKLHDEKRSDES